MEDEKEKQKYSSLPANYVSLAQLQERWLLKKQEEEKQKLQQEEREAQGKQQKKQSASERGHQKNREGHNAERTEVQGQYLHIPKTQIQKDRVAIGDEKAENCENFDDRKKKKWLYKKNKKKNRKEEEKNRQAGLNENCNEREGCDAKLFGDAKERSGVCMVEVVVPGNDGRNGVEEQGYLANVNHGNRQRFKGTWRIQAKDEDKGEELKWELEEESAANSGMVGEQTQEILVDLGGKLRSKARGNRSHGQQVEEFLSGKDGHQKRGHDGNIKGGGFIEEKANVCVVELAEQNIVVLGGKRKGCGGGVWRNQGIGRVNCRGVGKLVYKEKERVTEVNNEKTSMSNEAEVKDLKKIESNLEGLRISDRIAENVGLRVGRNGGSQRWYGSSRSFQPRQMPRRHRNRSDNVISNMAWVKKGEVLDAKADLI